MADFFVGMPFTKKALDLKDQAGLLLARGLIASEEDVLKFLAQVNYYRLSGYLFPFKKPGEDNFIDGTHLSDIKDRYVFDRRLRLLIMDAVERIEISILRSQFVELFGLKYGPFGFLDKTSFKDKEHHPIEFHTELVDFSAQTLAHDGADYITRYRSNYPDEKHLPIWILVEKMTFGALSKFVDNMKREDRIKLAERFDISAKVFVSWLHSIASVRNLCAHHERLWNRYISIEPAIPDYKNGSQFYKPVDISTHKKEIFSVIVIIQYLLNYIEDNNNWGERLKGLVKDFEHLPFAQIGFPDDWLNVPFWAN